MKKRREFHSSELLKTFAKIHGFEDKIFALEIKEYLREYLDESLFDEINTVEYNKGLVALKIQSPLLKNDFRLRKSFYINKFRGKFGEEKISDLLIL